MPETEAHAWPTGSLFLMLLFTLLCTSLHWREAALVGFALTAYVLYDTAPSHHHPARRVAAPVLAAALGVAFAFVLPWNPLKWGATADYLTFVLVFVVHTILCPPDPSHWNARPEMLTLIFLVAWNVASVLLFPQPSPPTQ